MIEIACDESGYEGEKLIGGVTDVFAHASVRMDIDVAADCIQELRNRIRSPASQYKANHVLREKHRPVLLWLLGPSGPLFGNSRVYLVDKEFLVVGKVVDLLVEDAGTMPLRLYREGRTSEYWQAFLAAANALLRTKDRLDPNSSVDSFFRVVEAMSGDRIDDLLGPLRRARPRADAFRARLVEDPTMIPPLDPLIPAIVRAVDQWGEGKPVSVVHDRQTTLSKGRIAQIGEMCRLSSLRLVVADMDSRVQMADFLAGVARKLASDDLDGRGDAELTELVRPYVDRSSIWSAPGWP